MSSSPKCPIPDSYWVHPNQLLAGEYPRNRDETSSRAKLRDLLDVGVTVFVNLTQPGEFGLLPYDYMLEKEPSPSGKTIEHHQMSIPDKGVPSASKMSRILDLIDVALEADKVVYVHCYAGIGRTGTVIGCHMVRHGKDGQEAMNEIARLRNGIPSEWIDSPETAIQRDMIRGWVPGK